MVGVCEASVGDGLARPDAGKGLKATHSEVCCADPRVGRLQAVSCARSWLSAILVFARKTLSSQMKVADGLHTLNSMDQSPVPLVRGTLFHDVMIQPFLTVLTVNCSSARRASKSSAMTRL